MHRRLGQKFTFLLLMVCRMRFSTPRFFAIYVDCLLEYFFPSSSGIAIKESQSRVLSWQEKRSRNVRRKICSSVEIIIVSTTKDFSILNLAILYAKKACVNFEKVTVKIIVPDSEIESCKHVIGETEGEICVVSEDTILDSNIRKKIWNFNVNRYGWCLQQFLKVNACLTSNAEFCLILDSDTLLLHPREWVNAQGKTILMPSEEFHQPYYDFLSKLGAHELPIAKSFVSHHMMIRRETLISMLEKFLGLDPIDKLADAINRFGNRLVSSPFCIDYEFYAQFAIREHNCPVFIEKFSNLGLPRNTLRLFVRMPIMIRIASWFWSSLSFHSWSTSG